MVSNIHCSLDEEANEIRVVILHPQNSKTDEINCTLHHISLGGVDQETSKQVGSDQGGDKKLDGRFDEGLDDLFDEGSERDNMDVFAKDDNNALFYEAVSYTWGELGVKYTIRVNDRDFAVAYNLWHLLHDLRVKANKQRCGRQLWIDTICIDQDNPDEKTRQIPRVWIIYEAARRVLIRLGPGTPESQWGIDFAESSWAELRMIMGDDFEGDDSIMTYDFDDLSRSVVEGLVKIMSEAGTEVAQTMDENE